MHIKQNRKCVACRNVLHQSNMLRVARVEDMFHIDYQQKLGGRGAYVCKNKQCIELTIKKRLFNKSFKTNVDSNLYVQLGEYEQNC